MFNLNDGKRNIFFFFFFFLGGGGNLKLYSNDVSDHLWPFEV